MPSFVALINSLLEVAEMRVFTFPQCAGRNLLPVLVLAISLTIQSSPQSGLGAALADQSQAISLNNEGVKALNANKYQNAIRLLESALKQDSNYELARDNLALAHNNYGLQLRNEPKQALKHFHQALYLNPKNPTTLQNIDGILRLMGRNPKSFEDRVDLGDQARLCGDFVGAIIEYKAATTIKDDATIHTKLADVYRVRGENDKAAQEDLKATNHAAGVSQNGPGPTSTNDSGVSSESEDRAALDVAVSERNAALSKDPREPKNHIDLGLAYQNRGDFGQAEAEYRMALRFSPGHRNPIAERLLAGLPGAKQQADETEHIDAGVDLQARKMYEQAIAEYKSALQRDPNNALIWEKIGTAFQEKEDYQNALKAYHQALTIDPNNQAAQRGIRSATEQQQNKVISESWKDGGTLFQQGKYEEAAEKYLAVLRVTPRNAAAHFALGAVYQAIKKLDLAISEYRLAVQYDPKSKQYVQACSDAVDLRTTGGAAELAAREEMPQQKVLEVLPDVERFEFEKARRQALVAKDYLTHTRSDLEQAWHSPPHTGLKITKVKIALGASGQVEKRDVLYASGFQTQDQSVIDLLQSFSFGALPPELKTLDLYLSFMSDGTMNMVGVSLSPAQKAASNHVAGGAATPSPLSVAPPHIGADGEIVAPP
jgi:tetratricopeptide (TPR) repeat protein